MSERRDELWDRIWGAEAPSVAEARQLQANLNAMESQVVETRDWSLRPEIFEVIWMPSSRIYQSPWWAMTVLMAMLLLMGWCSGGGSWARVHADDDPGLGLADSIQRYDRGLAVHRVERYRSALGFAAPISISVDRDSEMPKGPDGRQVDAHTTRSWERDGPAEGCTVHVTRISVQRASTLAHEVCHCKLDYMVLGAWGYVEVGADERRSRERRASECEDNLMKRGSW